MALPWSTQRKKEHQELLDEKYDGDVHNEDYKHEVYVSNMRNYRDRHREKVTKYNKEYQIKFRQENPYYYSYLAYKKNHPDVSLEEYIEFKKEKDARRKRKLEVK